MGYAKSFALAGLLAATVSTAAFAADLAPPPPPMEPLRPSIIDVGGGWYLRGDVGASLYDGAKFSQPAVSAAGGRFLNEDFGGGSFVGAGIGYQYNNWLRVDLTGEYRFGSNVGAVDDYRFVNGAGNPADGRNYYRGNYSAFVGLLNGYVDLGTWNGLTPYVGAGVGFAHNSLSGFTDQGFITDRVTGVSSVSGGYISDGTKTGLAWALHAGLGYDVSPNLKLEVGYRYLSLGDAQTGRINCFCGTNAAPLKVKDLASHDFKVGMRWMLGGPVAPMPAPEPIVSKF
jgi:opacity protein-like surface antigen